MLKTDLSFWGEWWGYTKFHFNTKLYFNAEFIILNTKSIIFDTKSFVFNTNSLILRFEVSGEWWGLPSRHLGLAPALVNKWVTKQTKKQWANLDRLCDVWTPWRGYREHVRVGLAQLNVIVPLVRRETPALALRRHHVRRVNVLDREVQPDRLLWFIGTQPALLMKCDE